MMNNQIPLKFRLLAAGLHGIGALIPMVSIPITWLLWMITKESHPFVDRSGKSALNFQSSIILYLMIIAGILGTACGVYSVNSVIVMVISYPAVFAIGMLSIGAFSLPILAAIFAIYGKVYSYPLTIKFLSEV